MFWNRKTASFGGEDTSSVSAVQIKLNSLGYANPLLVVDGQMGPHTSAAILAYQTANNLVASGSLDAETILSLGIVSHSPIELPNRSTPISPTQAATAFNKAYQKVTGNVPTPDVLNNLISQSAFETGNFGNGLHNYNFGNAKATSHDAYIQTFVSDEVINGVTVPVTSKFAAFTNATDGAVHFIKLLQSRPHWWEGLHTGSVQGFVAGLTSSPAYFTGDSSNYVAGMARYFSLYAALAQSSAVKVGVSMVGILAMIGIGGFVAMKSGIFK